MLEQGDCRLDARPMAKPLLKKLQMKTYDHLQQAAGIEANVSVSTLRNDVATPYRNNTDEATAEQYKLCMKEGSVFPPIDTVFEGQHHVVYDGFHRLAAISLLGKSTIAVRCIECDVADTQLLAHTVNAQYGLTRDLATKRKNGLAAFNNQILRTSSKHGLAKISWLSAQCFQSLSGTDTKIRQQIACDVTASKRIKIEAFNLIKTAIESNPITPEPKSDIGAESKQLENELKNYKCKRSQKRIYEEVHDRASIEKSIGYSLAVNHDFEN